MRDDTFGVPAKTGMTTIGGQIVLSDRLAQFRRIYRWCNLTLIHQGTWPLILLLTSAPAGEPQEIPMPWYLARFGAPLAAAAFAWFYLRNQPQVAEREFAEARPAPVSPARPGLAAQVTVGLIFLTLLLTVARLANGPAEPAAKLLLFGVADVLAFQLIHFEVVRRSYRDPVQGVGLAVVLFGLSWGLRDLFLTALGPDEASPALAFLSGAVLGGIVAAGSRVLRLWPGGFWPAASAHFLVVYLIFRFVE
jgi:hypothetical protein